MMNSQMITKTLWYDRYPIPSLPRTILPNLEIEIDVTEIKKLKLWLCNKQVLQISLLYFGISIFYKAEENGMYSALRILPSLLKNILHNSLFLLILTSKSKQNELIQACIRSKCRGLELIDSYISI